MSKKKKPQKQHKPQSSYENEFPARFTQCRGGKGSAGIGVKIPRGQLHETEACALFIGSQLEVRLVIDQNAGKDAKGQEVMEFAAGEFLEGVAECHKLSIDKEDYGLSLSFVKSGIPSEKLMDLACSQGKLFATRLGDAADKDSPALPTADPDEVEEELEEETGIEAVA